MTTSTKDLNLARKALVASLGDKSKLYFDKMRLWFQMKTSKEEFDTEARSIMTEDQVHLHNEFLLCLFNKVRGLVNAGPVSRTGSGKTSANSTSLPGSQQQQQQQQQQQSSGAAAAGPGGGGGGGGGGTTPQNSSSKEKRLRLKRKYKSDRANFEPADVYAEVLSEASSLSGDEPVGANRSSAQELVLPDRTFVLARLMLAAWENNMDGAEDSTAHAIIAASHVFLKNVLQAMMTRRRGFQVRDQAFVYGIGEPVPSSWRRNTSAILRPARFDNPTTVVEPVGQVPTTRMGIEDAEQAAAFAMACSTQTLEPAPPPLSVVDLLKTLRTHKNLVHNHTIWATNCERLFTFNTHSTMEDIEARKLLT